MKQNVQKLEDFLSQPEDKPVFRRKKQHQTIDDFIESQPKRGKRKPKEDSQILRSGETFEESKIVLANNSMAALKKSAKTTLDKYISKSPQYKTLLQQLKVLKENAIEYKSSGDDENYLLCKQEIQKLNETKKTFENIARKKTKVDFDETNAKIKDSTILTELKDRRKELELEYASLNVNTLVKNFQDLRKKLNVADKLFGSDFVNEDILDIDDVLDNSSDDELNENILKIQYKNLAEHICKLIDGEYSVNELMYEIKINQIKKALNEYMSEEDVERLEEVKNEILLVKMEASSEIKRLKGYNDVTDIMFNIFDFETEEEEPKEMLAASSISMVESMAYNECSRINKMQYFADAVSYGLIGLTLAINKWYKIQKLKDSAITFSDIAHRYIHGTMTRGLFELSSGGMISGSTLATLNSNRNKEYKFFIENNKEFSDLPKELVEDLLSHELDKNKPGHVMTESEYSDMVTGGESDADVWANAAASTSKDTYVESKLEYESLVNSLKALFNLFETKIDKKTGIRQITDKKLFTKYDYKLFLMSFGLMTKYNQETGKDEPYDQASIAEEMVKLYAADGIKNKTFSQPAIAARKKSILDRINLVMQENTEIKKGFEYLMYYFMDNSDNMNLISNSRDELGISFDNTVDLSDNTIRNERRNLQSASNDIMTQEFSNFIKEKNNEYREN